jgi:hypothetical protein
MKVKTNLKAGQALGDTLAEAIHATGLDKLTEEYTRLTGRDCGCKARQAWLNQWFPG